MTLQFISLNSTPTYIALSTDIVGGKIIGASSIGGTVLTTDDGSWYIIKKDLNLSPYSLPIRVEGSVSVGQVSQGTASLTEKWLTQPDYPLDMAKISIGDNKNSAIYSDEANYHVHTGRLWGEHLILQA